MKLFPYEVVIVLSEDVHLTEDVPGLMAVHHHHLVSPRVGTLTPKLRGVTVVVLHCDLRKNVFAVVFSEMHIYMYNLGFFFLFTYTKLIISNFRRISYIQYVFIYWIHIYIYTKVKELMIETCPGFSKMLIVFTSLFWITKFFVIKRVHNFFISAENFPNIKKVNSITLKIQRYYSYRCI